VKGRRTQAERRAATIGALVEGAIEVLATRGYAAASVQAICTAAGCTQGALYRHFATRTALLATVASELGTRNVAPFAALAALDEVEPHIPAMVSLIRDASRSEGHAAWREIVVAARTDPELREAVGDAVAELERAVMDTVEALFETRGEESLAASTTVLSLLHMFDSEAITRQAKRSPAVEAQRLAWAESVLRSLLPERAVH
jgi:AcrR family transcriptional regulator